MPKPKRLLKSNKNFVLASLPENQYARLLPFMQTVRFEGEQVIYRVGEAMEFVYFPTTAMMSWIATTREGERVEVGVVGWEGVVGGQEILGSNRSPYSVEVELPGEAIQIRADHFQAAFEQLSSIHNLLFSYSHAALVQLAQSSVCNRFHTVEERMLRWLLLAHDRSEGDELVLTQEILAGMIGARRPAVNIVTGGLQKAGLIRAERGRVTILNREGMETASCECYGVIRAAFDEFTAN